MSSGPTQIRRSLGAFVFLLLVLLRFVSFYFGFPSQQATHVSDLPFGQREGTTMGLQDTGATAIVLRHGLFERERKSLKTVSFRKAYSHGLNPAEGFKLMLCEWYCSCEDSGAGSAAWI